MDVVGDIVHIEDFATLDALNTAIEDILGGKDWDFDERHDGQLTLQKKWTTATASIAGTATQLATTATLQGINMAFSEQFQPGTVARLIFTEDEDYANTAFRIQSIVKYSVYTVYATLNMPVRISATAEAATLYWSEYILPDTVAAVTRVRHQENELTLEQVDPRIEFDELFPRRHADYGQPEIISVGGLDIETYETPTSTVPSPGLRMNVWPVPDENYVIDYSYKYRHPELVDKDSTLDGVTPEVVSLIVDSAATDMKIFYENDRDALFLRRAMREDREEMYDSHQPNRGARKPIGNWDGSAGRSKRRRDPFGGKLLTRG